MPSALFILLCSIGNGVLVGLSQRLCPHIRVLLCNWILKSFIFVISQHTVIARKTDICANCPLTRLCMYLPCAHAHTHARCCACVRALVCVCAEEKMERGDYDVVYMAAMVGALVLSLPHPPSLTLPLVFVFSQALYFARTRTYMHESIDDSSSLWVEKFESVRIKV